MFHILLLVGVLAFTDLAQTRRCPCEKYQPIGVQSDAAVLDYRVAKRPVNRIVGSVFARRMRGKGYESTNARIHVYRKSDGSYPFVAACDTTENGMFCFQDLPAATYLVCADNRIFSQECTVVTLNPKLRPSGPLKFTLTRLPI